MDFSLNIHIYHLQITYHLKIIQHVPLYTNFFLQYLNFQSLLEILLSNIHLPILHNLHQFISAGYYNYLLLLNLHLNLLLNLLLILLLILIPNLILILNLILNYYSNHFCLNLLFIKIIMPNAIVIQELCYFLITAITKYLHLIFIIYYRSAFLLGYLLAVTIIHLLLHESFLNIINHSFLN